MEELTPPGQSGPPSSAGFRLLLGSFPLAVPLGTHNRKIERQKGKPS